MPFPFRHAPLREFCHFRKYALLFMPSQRDYTFILFTSKFLQGKASEKFCCSQKKATNINYVLVGKFGPPQIGWGASAQWIGRKNRYRYEWRLYKRELDRSLSLALALALRLNLGLGRDSFSGRRHVYA